MFQADPTYAIYDQFNAFDLKIETDYDTKKQSLELTSEIIVSTMYAPPEARHAEQTPTIKKFYKKLEVYFDNNNDPAISMDLSRLNMDMRGPPTKVILDAHVTDSLSITLSKGSLRKFRKLHPKKVQVVFYDENGKIVTAAEASVQEEK